MNARDAARRLLGPRARATLARRYRRVAARPRVGGVDWGDLRRVEPLSREFGFERGKPVDRHYVEAFLREHAVGDIRGRVLEVGEPLYAERFAAAGAIERLDVLHVSADDPRATLVGDLAAAPHLPSMEFDCVICTQTLHLIYDLPAALRTLHRMLKPSGTLLVTVPGISQICRPEADLWGDHWRFTTQSVERLAAEAFGASGVTVRSYGNVLAAAAFLYGAATEELDPAELDHRDPDYELLIGLRAVRA